MSDDEFTPARLRAAVDRFNATLRDQPLRRGECLLVVAGDEPRRMLQHELADELRAAGMSPLARSVERTPIPREHVLCLCIGSSVSLFVAPMSDLDADPAPQGASALSTVLGAVAGGTR